MMRYILLVVFSLLMFGCSVDVAVNSDPGGAMVYLDDEPQGSTPLVVEFPDPDFTDQVTLKCEKEGYRTISRIIILQRETSVSSTTSSGYGVSTYNAPGTTGYGTASAIGTSSTITSSKYWPSEVFFKLEDEDAGGKENKAYLCPNCGKYTEKMTKFCPNCGGKMEGDFYESSE